MDHTVSTEQAVEAHVIVQYDADCPHECFLSYRTIDGRATLVITFGDTVPRHTALAQARAVVAPHFNAEAHEAQNNAYKAAVADGKTPAEARAAGVRARREAEDATKIGAQREAGEES